MKKILFFTLCVVPFYCLKSQQHIDTLQIDNYKIKTVKLPSKLEEISTLEFNDGFFWGLNDSGGKNQIYKFNTENGKIEQTVTVENAPNVDWEEMTFGNENVYIGDFGNNMGERKDLAVYYFPKSKLKNENKEFSVRPKKIEFSFPEQKNFQPGNKATNFDCEAMFYYNGKLHLFTKEWSSLSTTHYTLEIKPGKQKAKKIETFKTNYLVTGAFIDENPISNTNGFYLIGYTPDGFAFISGFSLPSKKNGLLFENKLNKFNLPLGFTAQAGQVEGIAVKPETPGVICYSNEDFKFKTFHVEQSVQCIYSLAQ
jgi:hypothetical protein